MAWWQLSETEREMLTALRHHVERQAGRIVSECVKTMSSHRQLLKQGQNPGGPHPMLTARTALKELQRTVETFRTPSLSETRGSVLKRIARAYRSLARIKPLIPPPLPKEKLKQREVIVSLLADYTQRGGHIHTLRRRP